MCAGAAGVPAGATPRADVAPALGAGGRRGTRGAAAVQLLPGQVSGVYEVDVGLRNICGDPYQ